MNECIYFFKESFQREGTHRRDKTTVKPGQEVNTHRQAASLTFHISHTHMHTRTNNYCAHIHTNTRDTSGNQKEQSQQKCFRPVLTPPE